MSFEENSTRLSSTRHPWGHALVRCADAPTFRKPGRATSVVAKLSNLSAQAETNRSARPQRENRLQCVFRQLSLRLIGPSSAKLVPDQLDGRCPKAGHEPRIAGTGAARRGRVLDVRDRRRRNFAPGYSIEVRAKNPGHRRAVRGSAWDT